MTVKTKTVKTVTVKTVKTGTIKRIDGSMGSGLCTLTFTSGETSLLESGFGMRMLLGVLGHPVGRMIRYEEDEFGVMKSFTPIEEETENPSP